MGRLNLMCVSSLLAGGLLWSAHPVHAAAPANDAPADQATSGDELQEVVITARKREEVLQNVPVAVTAFSGDQLKEQSVKTLVDIQGQVPGLYIQSGSDDIQSLEITLRGRKQNDTASTLDASVGLYVDGLYSPRGIGLTASMLDVNRLEVLRGPQGTLYGRNTTGGAIAVYTNNPTTDALYSSVDMTVGNLGAWNLIGIANVPINDNLSARFVAQRGKDHGYGHNGLGAPLASEDSQYYRAKLRATWGDHWEAILSGHWEQNITGGVDVKLTGLTPPNFQGNGLPEGGFVNLETQAELGLTEAQATSYLEGAVARANSSSNFYNNESTTNQYSLVTRRDVGLDVTGDLGSGLTLRSISGYQRLLRNSYFPSPIAVTYFWGQSFTESEYASQELQLLGTTPTLNWVAGLYGGYETGWDNTNSLVLPALAGPAVSYVTNGIQNTTASAFAQATWEFVPHWHLTAGARYSRDTREMDQNNTLAGFCQIPAPGVASVNGLSNTGTQCPRAFKNTFKKPSWLVSLDYQLTPDVLLYTKVSQGYRSGGENEGGSLAIESYKPFNPEINTEYEAGIKSEFLDHRVRLNVAGYYDDYKDLQVSTAILTSSGTFATVVSNAATAKIEGMELEGDFVVMQGLKLHASTAYTDAHYSKFPAVDPNTGLPIDRSHEPFIVPKFTASLSAQYVRPTGLGDLTSELDYSWKGTIVLDGHAVLQNQVTQGPVGLLDARVNLHVDTWNTDVALWGKNITDKQYYDQSFQFEALGVNQLYAAAPATFGIELTKKFGGK